MILVTGAAGFIGSNLIAGLNQLGECDILAVDDLQNGTQALNLADLQIVDYMDCEEFYGCMQSGHAFDGIRAVFHQGACSDTTEWNGRYAMRVNYQYSKILLHYCIDRHVPFICASSASVYGAGGVFKETPGLRATSTPSGLVSAIEGAELLSMWRLWTFRAGDWRRVTSPSTAAKMLSCRSIGNQIGSSNDGAILALLHNESCCGRMRPASVLAVSRRIEPCTDDWQDGGEGSQRAPSDNRTVSFACCLVLI